MNLLLTLLLIILLCLPVYVYAKPNKPDLRLAHASELDALFIEENGYWISEKYDGIRAFWDGKQLWTRQGQKIHSPTWFTVGFPATALDGELWIAREHFEHVSAIARTQNPDEELWRQVKYMAFDLPNSKFEFETRQKELNQLIVEADIEWLRAVKQLHVETPTQLQTIFQQIVHAGGEGIMINKSNTMYSVGRDKNLLKLKPYYDDEAIVLAHFLGQGKYAKVLGAMLVKNRQGKVFKLGSGFSDEERKHPPSVGSIVSYRYSGFTNSGKPRFAIFLRHRADLESLNI